MADAETWAAQGDMADYALALAADGTLVFPCGPDKVALLVPGDNPDAPPNEEGTPMGGYHAASLRRDLVAAFFSTLLRGKGKKGKPRLGPNERPMIGVPCVPNGIFVLDIDVPGESHPDASDGRLWIREIEDRHGPLPETVRVRTPSEGLHIYFLLPEDYDGKTRRLPGHCGGGDIKANGYVMAPLSETAAGKRYELLSPPGTFVAAPPDWLLQEIGYIRPAPVRDPGPADASPAVPSARIGSLARGEAWAAEALRLECDAVRSAPAGGNADAGTPGRDDQLTRSSYKMGQRSKYLDETAAKAALLRAARENPDPLPYSDRKLQDTIDRAWRAGTTNPKSPADRDDGGGLDLSTLLSRSRGSKAPQKMNGRPQKKEAPAAPAAPDPAADLPDDAPDLPQTLTPEEEASMLAEAVAETAAREEEAREDSETGPDSPATFLSDSPDVPMDVFPPSVQTMLRNVAESHNVPLEIPVGAFLGLLSSCVCNRRAVQKQRGYWQNGSLWLLLVAPSGIGKSPVSTTLFRELRARQRIAHQRFEKEFKEWENAYTFWKAEQKAGRPTQDPEPPKMPRHTIYYLDSTSPEAVAVRAKDNPHGLTLLTDEFGSVLAMDKYAQSGKVSGTKERLLSCQTRGDWDVTRVDEGKSFHASNVTVGIFSTVQTRVLKEYFDKRDEVSGFTPRFLFVRAELEKKYFLQKEDPIELTTQSENLIKVVTNSLLALQMERVEETTDSGDVFAHYEPKMLPLSREALAACHKYQNDLGLLGYEEEIDGRVGAWALKFRDLVLRLATLLHCLDQVPGVGPGGSDDSVSEDVMLRSIRLSEWLRAHQSQVREVLEGKVAHYRAKTPQERALIAAVRDHLAANGQTGGQITIANVELGNRTRKHLRDDAFSNADVGRTARRLGFKRGKTGSTRYQTIDWESFERLGKG